MTKMRPVGIYTRVLAALLLGLLATTPAFARHRKLSPELNEKVANLEANPPSQSANGPMVDVIIQFKPGAILTHGISRVIAAGGQHKSRLDVINGSLFKVPASLLPTLAADPDVAYISPDRKTITHGKIDFIMDATDTTSIIRMGYTGDDIGVAVIDSGVKANHPDLTEG